MAVPVVLCLCFAVLFLWQERKENYVSAVVLKGLASLCFVAFGFMAARGKETAAAVLTGLIMGCAADILLNLRWVLKEKGQTVFLVGILVFLGGHIAYLVDALPAAGGWIWCVITGAVLTALLMKWIFARITAKKVFKIFGVVYIGAVVLLNCAAVRNLFCAPSAATGLFAAGAVLFLASDIVLILNTFGGKSRFSLRATNVGLYYAGQLLIAASLLFR